MELRAVIDKAYEKKKLLKENLLLRTQLKRQSLPQGIITGNPLMFEILETVKKVANSDLPVLVYGESGVGKELVARAVHDSSSRADKPFIPLNCAAIPETMLESELFGHEKGAFTGAIEKKLGMLEVADKGTLFLDEVGELPLQLQVKLLRVIETKRFFRLGGVMEVQVDVKFISASNKDLKAAVRAGDLPARPVLPDQRIDAPYPAASRAERRYPFADRALCEAASSLPAEEVQQGSHGHPEAVPLARQCQRAAERGPSNSPADAARYYRRVRSSHGSYRLQKGIEQAAGRS